MSKIREAYLQRCEIGLLARERNEGRRLCRENDIVCYGGCIAKTTRQHGGGDGGCGGPLPLLEFTARKTQDCHLVFIVCRSLTGQRERN